MATFNFGHTYGTLHTPMKNSSRVLKTHMLQKYNKTSPNAHASAAKE
jgi:hypothetical protein